MQGKWAEDDSEFYEIEGSLTGLKLNFEALTLFRLEKSLGLGRP